MKLYTNWYYTSVQAPVTSVVVTQQRDIYFIEQILVMRARSHNPFV